MMTKSPYVRSARHHFQAEQVVQVARLFTLNDRGSFRRPTQCGPKDRENALVIDFYKTSFLCHDIPSLSAL